MKKRTKIILAILLVVVLGVGYASYGTLQPMIAIMRATSGSVTYENPEEYQLVFKSTEPFHSGYEHSSEPNVYNLVVEPVLNSESMFMKKATVQAGDGTVWSIMCDEGVGDYVQQAPNPLSIMLAGSSMNLLNQIVATAIDMDLTIDDITVEQRMTYRQPNLMTDECVGYADVSTTHIHIISEESEEDLEALKNAALASWEAGEGMANETPISGELLLNGDNFAGHPNTPGIIVGSEATVNGNVVMSNSDDYPDPNHMEMEDIRKISMINMDLDFEVVSVATYKGTNENPYQSSARVFCNLAGYASWDLYSDDAALYGGTSNLPTSLDYFTAGTGLCLTTQTTGAKIALGLDIDDYRIEQQVVYTDDTTESVATYIADNTSENLEDMEEYFTLAIQMCFAGENLKNETEMEETLHIN